MKLKESSSGWRAGLVGGKRSRLVGLGVLAGLRARILPVTSLDDKQISAERCWQTIYRRPRCM